MAFGRNGDARIGQAAARSHYFATRDEVLTGDLAQRMQTASQGAASALIEKFRWPLFSVGSEDDTAINALATDQPELADMIADHISERSSAQVGISTSAIAE